MKQLSYAFAALLAISIFHSCSTAPNLPVEESPYPKVNVAPHYQVDPSWPKRSEEIPWSDMPGVAIDGHLRAPPKISVTRSPDIHTDVQQAVISGVIEEDRGIRDVMVFHGEDKIFYRGGNDETRTLPFSVERWMEPGANSFYVLARDKDGLTASRMGSVWYDSEEAG